MLNARARLNARMRRGIDCNVFSKLDEKGIPATQATSSMEKEQGRTAAVGAELGLEHAVADGDRVFLHAIPSLCTFSSSDYTYLLLRFQHTGRIGPCQLFPMC